MQPSLELGLEAPQPRLVLDDLLADRLQRRLKTGQLLLPGVGIGSRLAQFGLGGFGGCLASSELVVKPALSGRPRIQLKVDLLLLVGEKLGSALDLAQFRLEREPFSLQFLPLLL